MPLIFDRIAASHGSFRLMLAPLERSDQIRESGAQCGKLGAGAARLLASLALFSTSAALADVIPPKVDTTTKWHVSPYDGSYRLDVTDFSIGDLKLERFTQSPSQYWIDESQFGMLMTSNFDIYVQSTLEKESGPPNNLPTRYHIAVHLGNSSVGVFYVASLTGSTAPWPLNEDAKAGTLAFSGTTFVFTDKFGAVYTFGGPSATPTNLIYGVPNTFPDSQRVTQIAYPNGRVRSFYYAGYQPKLITDSSGYAILFDIGSNGMISDACAINLARTYPTTSSTCAGQPLTVQYQYGTITAPAWGGTVPVLTGFVDALQQTTTYTQSSLAAITCITPPGFGSCQISYPNYVETLADGENWTIYPANDDPYNMNDIDAPVRPNTGGTATIIDPAGHSTYTNYWNSSPLWVVDANNNKTTYKWCCSQFLEMGSQATYDGTMLTEVDFPEGNKYLASYGTPFNAVAQERYVSKTPSTDADQVVNYGYTAVIASGVTIAKPTSKTTPLGYETDWAYTNFGEVQSEMQPAPASGGARPLKLYTYVQKSAYILNASSQLVASGHPTWVISTETECQTVAGSSSPVCDTGAPQKVTTYQYGADGTANNLNVRGVAVSADGSTRLTCYTYDDYGNKVSQTLPRGNTSISVCP